MYTKHFTGLTQRVPLRLLSRSVHVYAIFTVFQIYRNLYPLQQLEDLCMIALMEIWVNGASRPSDID